MIEMPVSRQNRRNPTARLDEFQRLLRHGRRELRLPFGRGIVLHPLPSDTDEVGAPRTGRSRFIAFSAVHDAAEERFLKERNMQEQHDGIPLCDLLPQAFRLPSIELVVTVIDADEIHAPDEAGNKPDIPSERRLDFGKALLPIGGILLCFPDILRKFMIARNKQGVRLPHESLRRRQIAVRNKIDEIARTDDGDMLPKGDLLCRLQYGGLQRERPFARLTQPMLTFVVPLADDGQMRIGNMDHPHGRRKPDREPRPDDMNAVSHVLPPF